MVAWKKERLRVNSGQVSWPLCTFPRSPLREMGIFDEEVDGNKTLEVDYENWPLEHAEKAATKSEGRTLKTRAITGP